MASYITKNNTYWLPPALWKEVKEYAGIFALPANIIHFDKLTFEELEETIDGYKYPHHNPFGRIGIETVYDIMVNMEDCVCAGYSIYYYDGTKLNEKTKKEWLVKWLKKYYRDEYGLRAYTQIAIKNRKERGLPHASRQEEIADFWNEVSKMITYHFENRDEKKEAAKKKRAKAKAYKSTAKGMIAEINKIEAEKKKLIDRINSDREKLEKLTTKGKEWRKKLSAKREENYQKKN